MGCTDGRTADGNRCLGHRSGNRNRQVLGRIAGRSDRLRDGLTVQVELSKCAGSILTAEGGDDAEAHTVGVSYHRNGDAVAAERVAAGRVAHHDGVLHKFARLRQVDNHLHVADTGSIG